MYIIYNILMRYFYVTFKSKIQRNKDKLKICIKKTISIRSHQNKFKSMQNEQRKRNKTNKDQYFQ